MGDYTTNQTGVASFTALTETHTFNITKGGYYNYPNTPINPLENKTALMNPKSTNTRIRVYRADNQQPLGGAHITIDHTNHDFDYDVVLAEGVNSFSFYLEGSAAASVSKSGFFSSQFSITAGDDRMVSLTPTGGGGGYGGGGGGCLLAGTPILMANGKLMPIERIKPGDMIMAFDEKTNQRMPDKVKIASIQESNGYMLINGRIKITGNHPCYVAGKWINARDLKAGDKLLTSEGKNEIVKSITVVDKQVLVYNFEVNPLHNYFADGVLVHNMIGKVQIEQCCNMGWECCDGEGGFPL